MPSLEALPPDQRAVVQLVLQQGRSYEEIAALLGIPVAAVRDRARSGVAALGDAAAPGEREAVVSDWLLGQAAVPTTLEDDEAARSFATRAAAGLAAVPGARVPDVPRATSAADADGNGASGASADADAATLAAPGANGAHPGIADATEPRADGPSAEHAADEADEAPAAGEPAFRDDPAATYGPAAAPGVPLDHAEAALAAAEPARGRGRRGRAARRRSSGAEEPASSSRLGGAMLLVALLAVLAGGAYLYAQSRDDGADPGPATTTDATTTTTTTPARPRAVGEIPLRPVSGGNATGVMTVYRRGDQVAFTIQARRLRPNTRRDAYAVWFTRRNGAARRLGYAEPVGADRVLGLTGPQQADLARFPRMLSTYDAVVVARETQQTARRPGTVVLRGGLPSS